MLQKVRDKSLKEDKEEEELCKDYQGRPEQIARRFKLQKELNK